MNPNYNRLNPNATLAALDAITNGVSGVPNPFNLTAQDLSLAGAVRMDLAEAATAQTAGALAQIALVRDKDAKLAEAGQTLSQLAKVALASSATDAQLGGIGLSRPAKPVKPTSLPKPLLLSATPTVDGGVKLAWQRGGAPTTTAYVVEKSADGLLWEYATVTTRSSLTLSGFAAGAPAWFRVRGTRAGLTSEPSNVASVFAPVAPSAGHLQVA